MVSRKQNTPNFPKNKRGKKCSFFGKFGVLCFLATTILRFSLLPYNQLIAFCSRKLRFNRSDTSAVMNLCLALLIAELAFGLGIHRADHPRLCQVIAVTLNYFLLCTLTWLGCGGVMLIRTIKLKDRIVTEQNDTILKYYLVAWGKCHLIFLNFAASVCLPHPNYYFNWCSFYWYLFIQVSILCFKKGNALYRDRY